MNTMTTMQNQGLAVAGGAAPIVRWSSTETAVSARGRGPALSATRAIDPKLAAKDVHKPFHGYARRLSEGSSQAPPA